MSAACMQLLTHTIYCLKRFLQAKHWAQTPSLFSVCLLLSKGKEAPPGWLCPQSPRWDYNADTMPSHEKSLTLSVLANINYKTDSSLLTVSTCFFPSTFRMQTWPACWVQVLLGTWRTWAWPSPTSPVPVPSSSSSCLHSNSSTSGPHRYTHST